MIITVGRLIFSSADRNSTQPIGRPSRVVNFSPKGFR
jgi:hypothetical protein